MKNDDKEMGVPSKLSGLRDLLASDLAETLQSGGKDRRRDRVLSTITRIVRQ